MSPGSINEQLQALLNRTAAASNSELERKTVTTYGVIQHLESALPSNEKGLSNYYLLFNTWIRWLADWDNYSLNLLHRRRLIGYLNRELGEGKYTLEIYPYTTRLYTIQPTKTVYEIRLHECMDFLPEAECRKFAAYIRTKRWQDFREMLQSYHKNSQRSQDLFAFFHKSQANPSHKNQTTGRYYDLETVFNSCNQRHFGGKISRPAVLHWSPRVNRSTMGSYNIKQDTLMINRGLDARDVPAYVLDFVMYHELLHKALGITVSGSRNLAHTKEFRSLERSHPDYERAEAFIKKRFSSR